MAKNCSVRRLLCHYGLCNVVGAPADEVLLGLIQDEHTTEYSWVLLLCLSNTWYGAVLLARRWY